MTTNPIIRILYAFLGLIFTLLFTSCYETKQEFTLNPDGSGKVLHECSFQNVSLTGDEDTSEEALQAAIAKVIEKSKGVDAWRDVSFKRLDDGRMWFRGTAYFKKLDDLEIQNQSMLEFEWKNQGDGKAELTLGLKKDDDAKSEPKLADMTPDERAGKLKTERAKFQQSKPMLTAVLGNLKQSVSFRLPGKIASSSNFKTSTADTLGLTFEGAKMLDALETLMNDDDWLTHNGFDAKDAPDIDNELGKLLFGEKAPVKATISGATQPLFDYAAEVAAARKEADKLQKQLGAVSIAPPAQGEPLKSIKVVGMRLVTKVDEKLGVRPFNWNPGYTLSVLAELPGSVLDVTDESTMTSAIANDGTSLLKGDRDWDRRIRFPKLSDDNASVIFDLELTLPPNGVTGLNELSGTLQYRVAAGTRSIDLGFTSLKVGAKGAELGASIEEIKEGWKKDGSQDMDLKLRLKPDDLKSVSLVVDGKSPATELERRGHSSSGGITTFTFGAKTALPENASIVVEIHDQIQTFEVPFKLENLSLLGTPAALQK